MMFSDYERRTVHTKALLVLAAVSAVAACGAESDSGSGASSVLVVQLTITDGVEIDEVAWTIRGEGIEDQTGVIDTSDNGATASIEVFGLPEGPGYVVQMTALTVEGDFFCEGGESFDVTAGIATPVELTLSCLRECGVLFCPGAGEQVEDCRVVDLPDGTECADGTGSCVDGGCELSDG